MAAVHCSRASSIGTCAEQTLRWISERVVKFRNRIGIDVAVEALRTGLEEGRFTAAELLRAAKTCRVDRVARPYLEALG